MEAEHQDIPQVEIIIEDAIDDDFIENTYRDNPREVHAAVFDDSDYSLDSDDYDSDVELDFRGADASERFAERAAIRRNALKMRFNKNQHQEEKELEELCFIFENISDLSEGLEENVDVVGSNNANLGEDQVELERAEDEPDRNVFIPPISSAGIIFQQELRMQELGISGDVNPEVTNFLNVEASLNDAVAREAFSDPHFDSDLMNGPRKCDFCPESFWFRELLKIHIETQHPNQQLYSCSYCYTNFYNITFYLWHMPICHARLDGNLEIYPNIQEENWENSDQDPLNTDNESSDFSF